jgi:hypothetical protein
MDDIIGILPENEDILSARNTFDSIKRANPTAIAKAWFKFVYTPYKDLIDNGDLGFFADKDYSTDLNNVDNLNHIMSVIDMIREPIREMNETNRAHTTKYLQNLCKLSALYTNAA